MKSSAVHGGLAEFFDYLPVSWRYEMEKIPPQVSKNATELRVRLGRGISVSVRSTNFTVSSIQVDENALEEIIKRISRGSLYQFEAQIRSGFIPLPGGHRVGIAGSYTGNDLGEIVIRRISSLNFRISRSCTGIAEELFPQLLENGKICSALIASEPLGGKTSMLTDLVRILSSRGIRSAVVDERREIAAVLNGVPQKDLGTLADVLDGYPKAFGMMTALRTLSPQVLVCDEIGSDEEAVQVLEATNAGVPVLATVHANSFRELNHRPQIKKMLDANAFSRIVFLKGAASPGKIREVYSFNDHSDTWSGTDR